MAMELATETVERSDASAGWAGLMTRLEQVVAGRFLLGCARWAVVFALIVSGYFSAAAIDAGLQAAARHAPNTQPMLATSAHK